MLVTESSEALINKCLHRSLPEYFKALQYVFHGKDQITLRIFTYTLKSYYEHKWSVCACVYYEKSMPSRVYYLLGDYLYLLWKVIKMPSLVAFLIRQHILRISLVLCFPFPHYLSKATTKKAVSYSFVYEPAGEMNRILSFADLKDIDVSRNSTWPSC